MSEFGAKKPKSLMLRTHCQTSGVSLTEQDPYNNIIRTTIEAMAAVLGGTQSLHTNSFDEAIALPTDFSARIARNTQLVIAEETGIPTSPIRSAALLYRGADQGAGGRRLGADRGGRGPRRHDQGRRQRHAQAAHRGSRRRRAASVDRGETTIVGVNRYRLKDELPIEILEIDNAKVRTGQIARLEKNRAGRDEAQAQTALDALREGARADANLLALCVDCARARCTLGEMSAAMEEVFGRYGTTPTPVSGIYGGAYKGAPEWLQAGEGVEAVGRRLGRKPRMLVAKMGQDGHDRGANLVSSAFADLGFEVIPGPLFQTPEESARLAIEKDVDVVAPRRSRPDTRRSSPS
jgi:methylmalonyl-CoA mutase